jgi:hypothetical protein
MRERYLPYAPSILPSKVEAEAMTLRVIARSVATKQSIYPCAVRWIASAFAKATADKSLRSRFAQPLKRLSR